MRFKTLTFTAVLALQVLQAGLAAETGKLEAGSDAPPLQAAATIKGQPVDLAKGVHVVELWATWCGPCKDSIPHLTELAKKFAGQADFTGVSIMEQGDALERVKAFVKQMGDKMDYNVAYDGPAGRVEKAWFTASGQAGIPTAFVVRDGKVVWIGHPMALEPVLTDVIAGNFDPKTQQAREEKMAQELDEQGTLVQAVQDASEANDFPGLLAAVKKVLAANPSLEPKMMPYQFEALAKTDLPAAIAYLKQWSEGPGFEQQPLNSYEAWLKVMQRSVKLSKEEWAFLAALLDRCNAHVTPINPLTASAEATSLARSGDLVKAAEWEKKALELAGTRQDGRRDWVAKHRKTLAEYQKQAGLEVSLPPLPAEHKPAPDNSRPPAPDAETGGQPEEPVPGAKLVGSPAPGFTLEDLDGKSVSLADLKGSVVVLDFWATWCGPCLASLPGLDALHRELSPRGLKVFAVDEAETPAKIRPTAAKLNLTTPILRDADRKVSDAYLIKGIPHTVVIGRDGQVAAVFSGSGNEVGIRTAALAALGLTERFALESKLPLIDDNTVSDQLLENGRKLLDAGRLVEGEQLARQLDGAARQPVAVVAAKIVPALPADHPAVAPDLYERCRPGVLVVAGVQSGGVGDARGASLFTATGFVVTASGVAVTNYHVVEEAKEAAGILALTSDGRAVAVRAVLAADRAADIAVVQLDGDGFTPLTLAEGAPVGAPVAVISHPDKHFYTFTRGVVSRYCLQRFSSEDPYPTPVLEITADYARGSSGGPLLDAEGRVIGMVCSTRSVYLHQHQEHPVGLQMVMKDSIPSELIIALLRGQTLKTLGGEDAAH